MSKRTILWLAVGPVGFIILAAACVFAPRGPSAAQFEYLQDPQVRILPDLKVLQVEIKGEPGVAAGQAFGLLFKTYYQLKGVPKGRSQPAPRARWPLPLETPGSEWVGRYALPIPTSVTSLPNQESAESGPRIEIAIWPYGDVAEVLHVGRYDREEPTIAKLTQFIKECGYEIIGEHEEEYLKGPGMFSKGNPDKYLTIIRYRVKKVK